MKIKWILAVVFLSTVLSGCLDTISSLHQPYKVNDIVEDKNILGNWFNGKDSAESSAGYTFSRSLDSLPNYIMYESFGKKMIGNYYSATVFKIGNETFVDFIQNMSIVKIDTVDDDDSSCSLHEITVREMNNLSVFQELTNFPVHTFAKLDYIGDTMRLSFISRGFVENEAKITKKQKSQIYRQKDSLRDVVMRDNALVFWSTDEIQSFIKKNAKDTSLYGSTISLIKQDKL